MMFFLIAASLSFVVLTAVTVIGVLKHFLGNNYIFLYQFLSGLVFITATAVLKPSLYGHPATIWLVLLEWIELAFATIAWALFVYFLTMGLEQWLESRRKQRIEEAYDTHTKAPRS